MSKKSERAAAARMLVAARNRKLSKARRAEIATHAATTRWNREREIRRLREELAREVAK